MEDMEDIPKPWYCSSSSSSLGRTGRRFSRLSKWSSLRKEVLENITSRFETRIEILRLRAVCKSWRSVIPIPIPFPPNNSTLGESLQPPSPIFLSPEAGGHFTLKENTVYCVQPLRKICYLWKTTSNWFVKIEEVDSHKVRLKDPLSTKKLGNIIGLPKTINLVDCWVKMVAKEYFLEYVGFTQEENEKVTLREINKSVSKEIKKVVLGENKDGDIVVMMLHFSGELKSWKMGEKRWANLDTEHEGLSKYQDIAFHKGNFYVVDPVGATSKVEYSSSLEVSKVAPPAFNYRASHRYGPLKSYLVSSFGDLFMVKYNGGSVSELPPLDVFKLDEERGSWVLVQGLEKDRVLFIGDGCSYSVSAKEFVGCKVNCVYFSDESDIYSGVEEDYPGLNASLYDLVDDVTRPLTSVVGYSQIFWPPPIWLNQRSSGK